MKDYIKGYALALLSVAKDEKKLKVFLVDAQNIVEALQANPDYINLLGSRQLDVAKQTAMLSKAFAKVEKAIANFINIAVDRGKPRIIVPALRKLISYIHEELDIHEGVVYSPDKLSSTEIEAITKKIAKQLNISHLSLTHKTDVQLIAGFRVEVNDDIIEDSVSSRLAAIKQRLLEGEK